MNFIFLGLGEVIPIAIREVGTGVSHGVIQPQLVEVISNVVVTLHVGLAFLFGVALLWQELAEL